jgi:hypothetical protein
MNQVGKGAGITRQGVTDTVWREGCVCLWVRNSGELLMLSADLALSDEVLCERFAQYLQWRRLNSPSPTKTNGASEM